jgi:hypothetical protein
VKTCLHGADYIAAHRRRLHAAIDENKWYLSEKAGHDVGFKTAENDFVERFLDSFARNFQHDYCRQCLDRSACAVPHASSRTESVTIIQKK